MQKQLQNNASWKQFNLSNPSSKDGDPWEYYR